ncbi:hypothetical protein ACLMJK_007398 [Lecanora helva]
MAFCTPISLPVVHQTHPLFHSRSHASTPPPRYDPLLHGSMGRFRVKSPPQRTLQPADEEDSRRQDIARPADEYVSQFGREVGQGIRDRGARKEGNAGRKVEEASPQQRFERSKDLKYENEHIGPGSAAEDEDEDVEEGGVRLEMGGGNGGGEGSTSGAQ